MTSLAEDCSSHDNYCFIKTSIFLLGRFFYLAKQHEPHRKQSLWNVQLAIFTVSGSVFCPVSVGLPASLLADKSSYWQVAQSFCCLSGFGFLKVVPCFCHDGTVFCLFSIRNAVFQKRTFPLIAWLHWLPFRVAEHRWRFSRTIVCRRCTFGSRTRFDSMLTIS